MACTGAGAEGYGNNWTIVYQTLPMAAVSLNYLIMHPMSTWTSLPNDSWA